MKPKLQFCTYHHFAIQFCSFPFFQLVHGIHQLLNSRLPSFSTGLINYLFVEDNKHTNFDFINMVAINELLCLKNTGAQISLFSPHMNNRHLWQLKKSKSLGPFWSYQLNSSANPAHLPQKWAKGAELAVLFS